LPLNEKEAIRVHFRKKKSQWESSVDFI